MVKYCDRCTTLQILVHYAKKYTVYYIEVLNVLTEVSKLRCSNSKDLPNLNMLGLSVYCILRLALTEVPLCLSEFCFIVTSKYVI